MESILKLLTDYKTDELVDLLYDDTNYNKSKLNSKYQKIYVYNKKTNNPLQKIWVQTPKMKVVRPTLVLNEKLNQTIPLYIMLSNNDFSKFLKNLERKLHSHVKNITKNASIKIKSVIKQSDNFPTTMHVSMPFTKIDKCVEFNFHIYNEYNKRININQINSGSYVSSIIELSDIWIGENTFGINWNVLQLKLYPEFDFTKCLFIDEGSDILKGDNSNGDNSNGDNSNGDNLKEDNLNECYHCTYCPNVRTHFCINSILPYLSNLSNLSNSNMDASVSHPIQHLIQHPIPPPPLLSGPADQLKKNQPYKPDIPKIPKPFIPSVTDLLSIKLRPVKRDIVDKNEDTTSKELLHLRSIKDNLNKINKKEHKKIDKTTLKQLTKMIDTLVTNMELEQSNSYNIVNIDEYKKIIT
ncbi:MAG: hypothetical protein Homavirus9_8 [Homavirus sp.]|uniref:Uncharacterized protein n=1 Tax=Homavirus sp. TaxID=2487769 RepID=A0A3G5A4F5_9VIRU|nr:MAG: hypothetical protein Homavirus9_8 [Homavirus sp.]